MQPFMFYCPTKIKYGEGTASSIAETVQALGSNQVFLVTDANLVKTDVLRVILEAFQDSGLPKPQVFDEVPPDSDLNLVKNAIALASASKCEAIVAVGGGSVIDTAKVTNIGLSLGEDILSYEGMNTLSSKLFPLVAIPTTAGTGSEVSAVAMIKDRDKLTKLLFGSHFLAPDVAILDPKLLISLPPKLTAATGMDALTHAIESYISLTNNPVASGLCLEAMKLIFDYLPRATAYGEDLEARSATLIASTMAGLSFTSAGVGIVHALAHTVGAQFGTHHGMTNAVLLPYGMRFNLDAAKQKLAAAWKLLKSTSKFFEVATLAKNYPNGCQDEMQAALGFIEAVKQLTQLCGLPSRLRDLGVPELSSFALKELALLASADPAIIFNPKEASLNDLANILKDSY